MKNYQFFLWPSSCLIGQKPQHIAMNFNLCEDTIMNINKVYLHLSRLDNYNQLLDDMGPDLLIFMCMYKTLKNNGLLKWEFIKDFINQYNIVSEPRSEVRS